MFQLARVPHLESREKIPTAMNCCPGKKKKLYTRIKSFLLSLFDPCSDFIAHTRISDTYKIGKEKWALRKHNGPADAAYYV